MPVITFQGASLSTEKKQQLIKEFTDKAVEITGTPSKFFTVVIQEFSTDNLGVAGETVTEIKARMQK